MELFKDLYVKDTLIVASSPHMLSENNTAKIMRDVLIALVPAGIISVMNFGIRALILAVLCVAAAMASEFLFQKSIGKKTTIQDGSAAVTGLILAYNLPPSLPYWMAMLGSVIAIVFVKQIFGGIGHNFANPAATARIILMMSFTTPMTTWTASGMAKTAEAVSEATPLALAASGQAELLPNTLDLFLGFTGGSMGETSAMAFLLGGVFLMARRVITPEIPAAFLGTMVIFALLAGEDPLFHIFAGGAMLGAFFMATDYSTSPMTKTGKLIFGIGCGLLTMTIRLFGSLPEGVSFAILFMNILTPHIDNFCRWRLYGRKQG